MDGAYDGIRVLDCTEGIAGPTATMHLADFGADVLKVETPAGDRLRDEPGYLCWNRNKRFSRLDAGDYRDLSELRRLIAVADAVVFDWPAAELDRLGLDATSLRAGRPELTYAWMPPYSQRGSCRRHRMAVFGGISAASSDLGHQGCTRSASFGI